MEDPRKKSEQPLWPIKVDVLGLPGSEHVPKRISVEVNGHTHVGNLCDHIARNSELQDLSIEGIRIDWSTYALWWPAKTTWLLNGSFTLDNWEISAADILEYVPKLYTVQLMLPDLQVFTFQLDFSKRVFEVVKDICRKLYLRRPEELSLYRPRLEDKEKKSDGPQSSTNGVSSNHSTITRFNSHPYPFSAKTIEESIKENGIVNLEKTPFPMPSEQHLSYLPCGKKMSEKTRLTTGWLSSALSLMQQDIRSGDVLLLRFKYCTLHIDLNVKKDPTRINMLYQQIRLSILNDENELTVEEATVLAGIMYQVHSQANVPQLSEMGAGDLDDAGGHIDDSAIEDELNNLAAELGSSNLNSPDSSKQANLTREPLLQNIVKVSRKKDSRLSKIGNPKFFVCTLQRFALTIFDRSAEETGLSKEKVINQLNVKGCEVAQIGEGSKFKLRLNVDTGSGMEEFHLRVDDLNTYAKWYAALQLASRGHTMADSSFEEQLKATREMLQYRAGGADAHDSASPGGTPKRNGASSRHGSQHGADAGVQVELFLSQKFIKKFKKEFHSAGAQVIKGSGQVSGMGYLEAKKQLIQRWNDVKLAGTQFFNCSVRRDNKPREKGLIGVCSDKLIQLDTKGQDIVQTYHYSSMMTWTVNWHKNELHITMEGMELCLETSDSKNLEVLHEYLGGYQIMGSRSIEQLDVDEEMFYKLTYGRKSEEEKIEELQKRDNQTAGLITHSVPNF